MYSETSQQPRGHLALATLSTDQSVYDLSFQYEYIAKKKGHENKKPFQSFGMLVFWFL